MPSRAPPTPKRVSGFAWVVLRLVTDETGHPSVTALDVFLGGGAEEAARRRAEEMNRTARKELMEVFLARAVGSTEGGEEGLG